MKFVDFLNQLRFWPSKLSLVVGFLTRKRPQSNSLERLAICSFLFGVPPLFALYIILSLFAGEKIGNMGGAITFAFLCFIYITYFFGMTFSGRAKRNRVFRILIFMGIIMIPIIFSFIYALVEKSGYECLLGVAPENARSGALYFSYVTFLTLGYGDIQPIGICRFVAVVEAITGFITFGVLIGLISSLVTNKSMKLSPSASTNRRRALKRKRSKS